MSIENVIYTRLNANTDLTSIVTGIVPAQAEINQNLPFVAYSVTGQDQTTYTSGQSDLTKFAFTIDLFGLNAIDLSNLIALVESSLNGWRGGNVQYCRVVSTQRDQQEKFHHGSQDYELWFKEANVLALPDATSTITTGQDYISFEACQNVLRVDCDGLTLNGDTIDGSSLPIGGTTGQVLAKASDTDLDAEWIDQNLGDVVGIDSATDSQLVSFDGTSGKLIKEAGLSYDANTKSLSTGSAPGWSLDVSSNKAELHLSSFDGGFTNATLKSTANGADFGTSNIYTTGTLTASNVSGTNTGDQTTITGNAATATALQTPRAINGVSFNGTAAITVTAAASTLTGTLGDSTLSSNVPLKNAANTFVTGQVLQGTTAFRQTSGSAGTDELQVYHDGDNAYLIPKDGDIVFGHPSNTSFQGKLRSLGQLTSSLSVSVSSDVSLELAGNGGMIMRDSYPLKWGSGNNFGFTKDTGLARDSAGVLRVTDGSSGTATVLAGVRPVHLANSSAANDTLYYSTTDSSLAYKTSGGTVIDLGSGGGGGITKLYNDFRISTESGQPISIADRTAQSTIYLTSYNGDRIHLNDGATWTLYATTEVSLALSGLTSGKNYDVFAYYTGSAVALELLVWTNDTTRATAIVRQDGIWVKSGAITRRLVGTIRTTGTTTTEDSDVKPFVVNVDNLISQSSRCRGNIGTTNINASSSSFAVVSSAFQHGVLTAIPMVGSLTLTAITSSGAPCDAAMGYSINSAAGVSLLSVIGENQVNKSTASCDVGFSPGYNTVDMMWKNVVGGNLAMTGASRGIHAYDDASYISVFLPR